jgi:hypothetical protein
MKGIKRTSKSSLPRGESVGRLEYKDPECLERLREREMKVSLAGVRALNPNGTMIRLSCLLSVLYAQRCQVGEQVARTRQWSDAAREAAIGRGMRALEALDQRAIERASRLSQQCLNE